jgi:multidrug efflux pump
MKKKNIYVLAEMPVTRAIIHLAVPSVLSMLVNIFYNLTDTFFIGKLNDPIQLAAVSISLPLLMFQMSIAGIFGHGGGSYLSRLLGKKDYDRAKETNTTAIASTLVLSVILGVIGLLSIPLFLKAVGASAETAGPARQYITVILMGSPLIMLKFALVQLIRAEGAAREAMYGLFIGTGANIILDPVFIFVFNMGVTGAAVATVIGQGIGMLYYAHFYYSKKSIVRPSRKYLHPRWEIYKEILAIGIPASLGMIMMSVGNTIAYNLASAYSDFSVAAMGVAARVFSIPIFIFIGISIGIQALIGFTYGAGNYPRMKRAIRNSLFISLGASVIFTLIFALFPKPLIAAFINDPNIITIGRQVLKAYVFAIPFAAAGMIMMCILQAMGKALPALIVSLSRQGIVYIPALFALNELFGFSGLIFAMPLADAVTTLVSSVFVYNIVRKLSTRLAAPSAQEYIQPVPAEEV